MAGTVSGEHGIGLQHRDFLVEELGTDTIETMRRLKAALDPKCLLNCDKIFSAKAPSAVGSEKPSRQLQHNPAVEPARNET